MKTLWVALGSVVLLGAQTQTVYEWRYWSGDQGQAKYATVPDITPANVGQLERAWEWNTGEMPQGGMRPGSFEATPLMIDDVLYLSTPYHRAVALNAETGAQLWAFDPEAYKGWEDNTGLKHRGVAYWPDAGGARIFLNTDQRLFALDAKTGAPIQSFGKNGVASLTEGMKNPVPKQQFSQGSPVVVYKDFVIVGSRIPDRLQSKTTPPGTVQAFDARTGQRRWIFYTIPQSPDAFGAETWENGSWAIAGGANVWGPMSVDETRGLLYVPVSTASGDYWGGRRLGTNLFSETLVCLDAATGQRKWHFQTVHHGLWDYDLNSPPHLMTITVDGKRIDVVAQLSKQGFTYVFDRVTGVPVWPIVERPVDTETDVPGERPHPTQPFPTKPPAYATQGVNYEDANNLTPAIRALALEQMRKFRIGPCTRRRVCAAPSSVRASRGRPTGRAVRSIPKPVVST